jgi:hypothetical protein
MPAIILCPKKHLPPSAAPMTCKPASRKPARLFSASTELPPLPQPACEPNRFRIVIRHPLPSLNAVLGMGHWQRAKLKQWIQDSTLSALRASECDSSTRITSFRSGMSIPSDTLASYQMMRLKERESKQAKKKLERKKKNARK